MFFDTIYQFFLRVLVVFTVFLVLLVVLFQLSYVCCHDVLMVFWGISVGLAYCRHFHTRYLVNKQEPTDTVLFEELMKQYKTF